MLLFARAVILLGLPACAHLLHWQVNPTAATSDSVDKITSLGNLIEGLDRNLEKRTLMHRSVMSGAVSETTEKLMHDLHLVGNITREINSTTQKLKSIREQNAIKQKTISHWRAVLRRVAKAVYELGGNVTSELGALDAKHGPRVLLQFMRNDSKGEDSKDMTLIDTDMVDDRVDANFIDRMERDIDTVMRALENIYARADHQIGAAFGKRHEGMRNRVKHLMEEREKLKVALAEETTKNHELRTEMRLLKKNLKEMLKMRKRMKEVISRTQEAEASFSTKPTGMHSVIEKAGDKKKARHKKTGHKEMENNETEHKKTKHKRMSGKHAHFKSRKTVMG